MADLVTVEGIGYQATFVPYATPRRCGMQWLVFR